MIAKYQTRPKPEAYETKRDGRQVCRDSSAGRRDYLMRTCIMAFRQNQMCAICGKFMVEITFDHQAGRGMSGGFRDDRILIDGKWHNAAVHWLCNGAKGSRQYAWLNGKYVPVEATNGR